MSYARSSNKIISEKRGRIYLLENKSVPIFSVPIFSVGTLSGAVVHHYRSSCKQLFRDVMKVSLWAGFILYFVSIFFGKELRYRLFD